MTIKVIVNGAAGKMGTLSAEAIEQQGDLELVAAAGRGDDLGQLIHDTRATVVVDFTHADSAFDNAITIIENGARPVIGTSGLNQDSVNHLAELCQQKQLGGVIAPNFTIGAVLMMLLAKKAAPYYQYAEIIEMHHQHKSDAPSGTATRTAEMMVDANPNFIHPHMDDISRGDDQNGIPTHSVRLPGLFSHQSVIFGDEGETLTIRHDGTDRKAAMPGVVLACRKAAALDQLVYGLEHILDDI